MLTSKKVEKKIKEVKNAFDEMKQKYNDFKSGMIGQLLGFGDILKNKLSERSVNRENSILSEQLEEIKK